MLDLLADYALIVAARKNRAWMVTAGVLLLTAVVIFLHWLGVI